MNIPDWVAEYVDEVNNGYRFSVYISQGLDVSNLEAEITIAEMEKTLGQLKIFTQSAPMTKARWLVALERMKQL